MITNTITKGIKKDVGTTRVLFLSDLHLLHRRVPTYHIVEGIKEALLSFGDTIDALYITGDVFDDSRSLRQDESKEALDFISWICNWSVTTSTAVRVLEGTPSHDHGQSDLFVMQSKYHPYSDVLYLSGIGVFYDEAIKQYVGWVEDEYRLTAEETENEMRELLATHGVERVSFFAMHGLFNFQLPIQKSNCFNESFWIDRSVNGVVIGHDHRRKSFKNIYVPGSWERLAQGEEEDKGGILFDFVGNTVKRYFLKNERACPQIKVRANEDYDAQYQECLNALKYIDSHVSSSIGRLDIEYYHGSPIAEHVSAWKKQYSFYIVADRVNTPEDDKMLQSVFSETTERLEAPNPDNVERIALEELAGYDYDHDVVVDIIRSLK